MSRMWQHLLSNSVEKNPRNMSYLFRGKKIVSTLKITKQAIK